MQPRITQVPPIRDSSASATRAPDIAAIRAARTPPEPPPITNRSKSYLAMTALSGLSIASHGWVDARGIDQHSVNLHIVAVRELMQGKGRLHRRNAPLRILGRIHGFLGELEREKRLLRDALG